MRYGVSSTWRERVGAVSTLFDELYLRPGYHVSQKQMCMPKSYAPVDE